MLQRSDDAVEMLRSWFPSRRLLEAQTSIDRLGRTVSAIARSTVFTCSIARRFVSEPVRHVGTRGRWRGRFALEQLKATILKFNEDSLQGAGQNL